jgi:hypothetical protein
MGVSDCGGFVLGKAKRKEFRVGDVVVTRRGRILVRRDA